MPLNNYRDVSVTGNDIGAGFQFEFYCSHCRNTWRTPFRPYRRGQLAALLGSISMIFGGQIGKANRATGVVSQAGARGAKEGVLQEMLGEAEGRFRECRRCKETVCLEDCWNDGEDKCQKCVRALAGPKVQGADPMQPAAAAAASGPACPNCQTAVGGGRFCPECGFDMASTHKTCPACGTMQTRQARFCTDCGHSF